MIGESFGKLVQVGQHGEWDSDLSYNYVGVLVSEGKRIHGGCAMEGTEIESMGGRGSRRLGTGVLGKERSEEVAPVNRSQSLMPEKQTFSNSDEVMEGTIFSGGNKESFQSALLIKY
ncbi:hypothetical protein Hanom_Chr06g00503501 [Helianthus anomalus]